jgi:hypothetical protein
MLFFGFDLWRTRAKLKRHQGVSRDEFVRHFLVMGIAEAVSGVVYEHFQQLADVENFQPAPTDSFGDRYFVSAEGYENVGGAADAVDF